MDKYTIILGCVVSIDMSGHLKVFDLEIYTPFCPGWPWIPGVPACPGSPGQPLLPWFPGKPCSPSEPDKRGNAIRSPKQKRQRKFDSVNSHCT